MNKRKTGSSYEEMAVQYLKRHNLKILERNYRIRQGEVDIIALDEEVLVFFEVKYRKNSEHGYPAEAVTPAKQYRICRVAGQYCCSKHIERQVRYDVISICNDEITWYRDAFTHIGAY